MSCKLLTKAVVTLLAQGLGFCLNYFNYQVLEEHPECQCLLLDVTLQLFPHKVWWWHWPSGHEPESCSPGSLELP